MAKDTTRREFLKAGAVTVGAGVTMLAHPERVFGANDRVRIGVCGLRGRGKDHIEAFSKLPNVEVAAICDVDNDILHKRREGGVRTYVDVRKMLEDKTVDAISIATPNHWHALMGIWACQAGKDVYIEKPCSHNVREGRLLVQAAQKYGRIVQHGTQSRSAPAMIEAIGHLRGGTFGDIYMARGLCFKHRDTIGHAAIEAVPPGFDYDLWTGPAPMKPFTRNRYHYNWHWLWDTGNGDLGNQAVHQVDAARWGLGVRFPNLVSAVGGHFMYDDDQETPNTLNCAFAFEQPNGRRRMLEMEVRHWISNNEAGLGRGVFNRHNSIGDIFYGSKGYLAAGNEDAFSYESWLGTNHSDGPRGKSGNDHFANFVNCVRSRKAADLRAPIEEGHISCTLVHLANASYRLGRSLRFDPDTERVIGDDEADRLLEGDARGYRSPFVMPAEV